MEWESPAHKTQPNKGRRAGLSFLTSRNEKSLEADSPPSTSPTNDPPIAPPRARRTGGWADEAIKSSKKRTSSSFLDRERFGSPERNRKFDDSDEDILLIPELEDALDDETTSAAHHAPTLAMNRVETYKELDSNILKNSSFTKIDDINLSLLARALHSEAEVMEETDAIWTWDALFTDVSSELHKEWDSKEASADRPNSHIP